MWDQPAQSDFSMLVGSPSLEVFNRIRLPREPVVSPALEVFKT